MPCTRVFRLLHRLSRPITTSWVSGLDLLATKLVLFLSWWVLVLRVSARSTCTFFNMLKLDSAISAIWLQMSLRRRTARFVLTRSPSSNLVQHVLNGSDPPPKVKAYPKQCFLNSSKSQASAKSTVFALRKEEIGRESCTQSLKPASGAKMALWHGLLLMRLGLTAPTQS